MSGILLIDAEQPFAGQIMTALQGRGFSVKHLDDGKDGLDYARDNRPDLIVLCVELPKMSGYSICNKLKKDNDLKGIPLIITSKEATPETFAQHKKLKTRAEDYLIKPFAEAELLEKIGALITLPSAPAAGSNGAAAPAAVDAFDALDGLGDAAGDVLAGLDAGSDDLSLAGLEELGGGLSSPSASGLDADDEAMLAGLDDLGVSREEPLSLDSLDLGGPADSGGAGSDDLDLGDKVPDDGLGGFDQAFEAIGETAAPEPAPPPAAKKPDPVAAKPAPPPAAAKPSRAADNASSPPSASSVDAAEMAKLRRESTDMKAKVVELEAKLKAADEAAKAAQAAASQTVSSASGGARDVLNLKEQLRAKEKEIGSLKDEVFEKEKQVVEVQEQLDQARADSAGAAGLLAQKDAEIASLQAKVDAVTEQRDELEEKVQRDLAAAESERDRLRGDVDDLRAEIDTAKGELEAAKSDVDAAKAETAQKKNEVDRARTDVEDAKKLLASTKSQLETRIRDLEGESRGHEERYLKAYQRLKADEAVREKAKKAVEIAFTLLNGEVESKTSDLADLDQIDA